MMGKRRRGLWVAAVFFLALPSSCILAAAGAGAGGGIHFTGNTGEAVVDRSVSAMADRALSIMSAEGIEIVETRTERSGELREWEGKKGELDVTVSVQREDGGKTKVRVSARRNLVRWDNDYARELLARIIDV